MQAGQENRYQDKNVAPGNTYTYDIVAVDAALNSLGRAFVSAAESTVDAVFTSLESTTRVDLGASWFEENVRLLATVTLPVLVGLFAIQVMGSVLRREPGGLARAVERHRSRSSARLR